MMNRNVYNNYNLNDSNYRNSLLNRITVNKKATVNNKLLKLLNYNRSTSKNRDYKDYNIYYENKNKRNKLSEEKINKKKEKIYYNKRDSYKKTINTYSNDNKMKDCNIFEELQNNKYLRPMLGTTNINKKLLKCQIEEPMKNIYTLSLKNYFANIELPLQKCQSPQKENMDDEDNILSYNLNNRTVMDRFNININNEYSPLNENKFFEVKNNSNSFIYKGNSYNFNNYSIRYSIKNIQKYSANKIGGDRDRSLNEEKNYYSKKNKEKFSYKHLNKNSPTIYYKNAIGLKAPFNRVKKNNNKNKKINNISLINKMQRDNLLLQIYQTKLVEEFIVILNKVFLKSFKKNCKYFFKNFFNVKNKAKIYFKKKNSRQNIKKLSLNESKKNQILLINQKKNKSKITKESIINSSSKSFSNEFKSSSLTNNFRTNNNKVCKQNKSNKSYILSEKKNLKYYNQSPDDSLNKHQQLNIRKKVIIHQKKTSGSHNKVMTKSPSQFETKESCGDIFIYKKKNMKNDYLNINKNNKNYINLSNIYSNNKYSNNKYNNIITNNKKGKIIDIDINLGKPINSINDHSPIEEFLMGNNQSNILNLDIGLNRSLNMNINRKKKNKANSGSKNKNKPPINLKKFLEEDDDDIFDYNNFYLDYNRANSSMRKNKNNNKICSYFEFKTIENNKNHKMSFNKEIKKRNKKLHKKRHKKLFIRFNELSFLNKEKNKNDKDKIFQCLVKENDISIFLNNKKNIKSGSLIPIKKNKTKKTNKANILYINCTKFLEKIFSKIIKKKVFILLMKHSIKLKK